MSELHDPAHHIHSEVPNSTAAANATDLVCRKSTSTAALIELGHNEKVGVVVHSQRPSAARRSAGRSAYGLRSRASAKAMRRRAPSPCQADPCMHAKVWGFSSANRTSVARVLGA